MNPEENEEDRYRRLAENQVYCELNLVMFLDSIANAPILMQDPAKAIEFVTNKIVIPYLDFDPDFKSEWASIIEDINAIFQIVNRTIQENKLQIPYAKPNLFKNIIITILMFIPMVLLMIYLPQFYYVALLVFCPIMCAYSYYKNKKMSENMQLLFTEIGPLIENRVAIYREKLTMRIQDLIDSSSRMMNDNDIDPEKYKMRLYNNEYDNIEVLSSQPSRLYNYYNVKLK